MTAPMTYWGGRGGGGGEIFGNSIFGFKFSVIPFLGYFIFALGRSIPVKRFLLSPNPPPLSARCLCTDTCLQQDNPSFLVPLDGRPRREAQGLKT